MFDRCYVRYISHIFFIVAVLEVKPQVSGFEALTSGTIIVKLRRLDNHGGTMAINTPTLPSIFPIAGIQYRNPNSLNTTGVLLLQRYESGGEMAVLEIAISVLQKVVSLTYDEHRDKPGRLTNLGHGQQFRFTRFGELTDVDNAISNHQTAVDLTDDSHPSKPDFLSNLGVTQKLGLDGLET
jgi:hypothetical protein